VEAEETLRRAELDFEGTSGWPPTGLPPLRCIRSRRSGLSRPDWASISRRGGRPFRGRELGYAHKIRRLVAYFLPFFTEVRGRRILRGSRVKKRAGVLERTLAGEVVASLVGSKRWVRTALYSPHSP
jgi:hypothetical protein